MGRNIVLVQALKARAKIIAFKPKWLPRTKAMQTTCYFWNWQEAVWLLVAICESVGFFFGKWQNESMKLYCVKSYFAEQWPRISSHPESQSWRWNFKSGKRTWTRREMLNGIGTPVQTVLWRAKEVRQKTQHTMRFSRHQTKYSNRKWLVDREMQISTASVLSEKSRQEDLSQNHQLIGAFVSFFIFYLFICLFVF